MSHAQCMIPNCRNHAPATEAFCAAHRHDQKAPRGSLSNAARRLAVAERMAEALRLAIPENICLTNRHIPDSHVTVIDVPLGDLRLFAVVLAEWDALKPAATGDSEGR